MAAPTTGTVSSTQGTSTLSHTTDANTDILVVCCGTHQGTISDVTWDGVSMTEAATAATAFNETAELWYTTSPGAKTANVVVTATGSSESIIAVNVEDADTTWTPTTASNTGASSTATVSVTTTVNDSLVIDSSYSEAAYSSVGASQTQLAVTQDQSFENGAASKETKATAGSVTMDWTLSSGQRWASVAVVFEPLTATPSTPKTLMLTGVGG